MSSEESENPLSREELEERIVALVLGELDADEAAKVEAAVVGDEILCEFHRRMELTLGFVQEAVDTSEVSKAPAPMRLSEERREALFQRLRVVEVAKADEFRRRWNRKWTAGLAIAAGLAVICAVLAGLTGRSGYRLRNSSDMALMVEPPGESAGREMEAQENWESEGKSQIAAFSAAPPKVVNRMLSQNGAVGSAAIAGDVSVDGEAQQWARQLGTVVGVKGSGIDAKHPGLQGRVIDSADKQSLQRADYSTFNVQLDAPEEKAVALTRSSSSGGVNREKAGSVTRRGGNLAWFGRDGKDRLDLDIAQPDASPGTDRSVSKRISEIEAAPMLAAVVPETLPGLQTGEPFGTMPSPSGGPAANFAYAGSGRRGSGTKSQPAGAGARRSLEKQQNFEAADTMLREPAEVGLVAATPMPIEDIRLQVVKADGAPAAVLFDTESAKWGSPAPEQTAGPARKLRSIGTQDKSGTAVEGREYGAELVDRGRIAGNADGPADNYFRSVPNPSAKPRSRSATSAENQLAAASSTATEQGRFKEQLGQQPGGGRQTSPHWALGIAAKDSDRVGQIGGGGGMGGGDGRFSAVPAGEADHGKAKHEVEGRPAALGLVSGAISPAQVSGDMSGPQSAEDHLLFGVPKGRESSPRPIARKAAQAPDGGVNEAVVWLDRAAAPTTKLSELDFAESEAKSADPMTERSSPGAPADQNRVSTIRLQTSRSESELAQQISALQSNKESVRETRRELRELEPLMAVQEQLLDEQKSLGDNLSAETESRRTRSRAPQKRKTVNRIDDLADMITVNGQLPTGSQRKQDFGNDAPAQTTLERDQSTTMDDVAGLAMLEDAIVPEKLPMSGKLFKARSKAVAESPKNLANKRLSRSDGRAADGESRANHWAFQAATDRDGRKPADREELAEVQELFVSGSGRRKVVAGRGVQSDLASGSVAVARSAAGPEPMDRDVDDDSAAADSKAGTSVEGFGDGDGLATLVPQRLDVERGRWEERAGVRILTRSGEEVAANAPDVRFGMVQPPATPAEVAAVAANNAGGWRYENLSRSKSERSNRGAETKKKSGPIQLDQLSAPAFAAGPPPSNLDSVAFVDVSDEAEKKTVADQSKVIIGGKVTDRVARHSPDGSLQNTLVDVQRIGGVSGGAYYVGGAGKYYVTNGSGGFAKGRFKPDLVAPGTFISSKTAPDFAAPALVASGSTSEGGADEARGKEPPAPVRPKKPKTLKPKPEVLTKDNAFSTFSLNVSDVAFKLAVASLKQGKLPEPDTVRSEEFVNALNYHDPAPTGNEKLAFAWERARNPFAHNRDLLRFSVQTAARGRESGQPLNLVVLLDASGSMERPDRVQIVREMLAVLAGELKAQDKISVVAFARTPWLVVDGMVGGKPKDLLDRILNITPQGGTNLETGLDTAYSIARRHLKKNGNNRVIVLTDGAANLGNINPEQLKAKVESQRKRNIALDCFGVGWEGYNDTLLESLSRNGDGRYGFINDPGDARHGFASLLAGALQVAAANVKTQIEFNTNRVIAYRQIGYDKHQLKKEQFRDNTVDAAEIGAAEAGTAMYSIQVNREGKGPLGVVRVRYKVPATGRYLEEKWELPYDPVSVPLEQAKPSMRLATVASSFAEWLAANPHAGSVSLRDLQRYLTGVSEEFSSDERPKQLVTMLRQARRISGE